MQLFKNNAYSTLAGTLLIAGTSMTVATGTGDRFPVVAGADYALVTLQDASNHIEIVKVTSRAIGADAMTIDRAQEGTTALNWAIGDIVECRVTAGSLGPLQVFAGAATALLMRGALGISTFADSLVTAVDAAAVRLLLGITTFSSTILTAANAAAARVTLGAAASGGNSDITSLTGLTTPLSPAQGGTGQTSLAAVTVGGASVAGSADHLASATGSAGSYAARCYCTINTATGGTYSPSLPAGNVYSIVKIGIGNFRINFDPATPFIDSEYVVVLGADGVPTLGIAQQAFPIGAVTARSNTYVEVQFFSYTGTTNTPAAYDPPRIHLSIFR